MKNVECNGLFRFALVVVLVCLACSQLAMAGPINGTIRVDRTLSPGQTFFTANGTRTVNQIVAIAISGDLIGNGTITRTVTMDQNGNGDITGTLEATISLRGGLSGTISCQKNGVIQSYIQSYTVTCSGSGSLDGYEFTFTATGSSSGPLSFSGEITIAPTSTLVLSFHAFPDGPLPPPQTPVVPELAGVTGWTTEVRTGDGRNWLEVTLVSGDLVVAVDPRELAPGEYHGTITIELPRWTITILNVTLIVHEFPRLVADPRYLEFTYDGQTMPAPQKVKVVGPKDGVEFTCQIHTVGKVWVSLAPDPAVTPAELTVSVDPTGMATGVYDAVVGFVSAGYSSPVGLIVRLVVGVGGDPAPIPGAPYVTAAGVVNGASYLHGPVAPGEILAIFGKDLGPRGITLGRVDRAAGWLGTELAGTRFLFDGAAAPIIFLSEGQAAAIAPYGIHGKASTILEVERDGVKSPPVTLPVAGAFPGVFTTNMTGTGPGAILDKQYLVVSKINPAPKGSKISIYLTGGGMVDPMPSDGELADPDNLALIGLPVVVTVGGAVADLLYAGEAPFYASGLLQVDARLSPDTPAGDEVPVVVTIGGAASQPGVTMAVR